MTSEYVYFGGKRIAMLPAGGSPQYYVEDFLGSSRVVTQSNGVVCYDSDFTPFGGELAYTNACPAQNNYKFEGKERDTETGNDDFGARYYTWRFGRWLSADWSSVPVAVPYANLINPQTLNLYAMVADDPESFADLDGHCGSGSPWTQCKDSGNADGGPEALSCSAHPDSCQSSADDAADQASVKAVENAKQKGGQTQTQQKKSAAPANSRTDVVLYSTYATPTPRRGTYFLWETEWKAGSCSENSCSQSSANENQTITLVESQDGGPWKPEGDPSKGTAYDQISPEAKTFNQRWFVDGKQVQVVVGKDSKGNLIKTWEVHVVIPKTGDRPAYSPVP